MRRRRGWRRAGLVLAGTAVPLFWLATAAEARVGSATVGDVAEAWYAKTAVDVCTTPLGCPPADVPTSPYPADTLHVGVAGGQETARTYLLPDLSSLPFDATATEGTMMLPVATGQQDGTVTPESAKVVACLATKPVTDGVQGSGQAPPDTDCKVSAPLKYDADKTVFTLDLMPFLDAWDNGSIPLGIALLPDPDKSSPSDAWHVTFNGRKRTGGAHISSEITYTVPDTSTSDTTGTTNTPTTTTPPTTTAPPPTTPNVQLPPTTTAPPPATAPQVAPTQPQPVAQPVAFNREFQYPMAFLAPLALLAGAVFFARLFTRDATPMAIGK